MKTLQIQAIREAGKVQRCHTMGKMDYSVAEHTYGVLSLILMLHPNPSLELLRAALVHDLPERWTGDVPHSFKADYTDLEDVLQIRQRWIEIILGLAPNGRICPSDGQWLACADLLDLWLWCRENEHSSRRISAMKQDCAQRFYALKDMGRVPEEIWKYWEDLHVSDLPASLPDHFGEVEKLIEARKK